MVTLGCVPVLLAVGRIVVRLILLLQCSSSGVGWIPPLRGRFEDSPRYVQPTRVRLWLASLRCGAGSGFELGLDRGSGGP